MSTPDVTVSPLAGDSGAWLRATYGAGSAPRPRPADAERLRVLLVEDDPEDAFLVAELLAEVDAPVSLRTADSLGAALDMLPDNDCVLLDLNLPDADGLDGLRRIRRATAAAVCVLTGIADEPLGVAAVAEGAQDYLVKGRVDGVLLARAVRYAVERRRADENAGRLREAELRQAESARLERGLLPQPLLDGTSAGLGTFYRPGRRGVLGGDFYDAIGIGSDRLMLLVGDVSGHGVDEAALGVELRAAWRALVLAGVTGDALFATLERVLVSQRRAEEIYATLAMVDVRLDSGQATVYLCGHPTPLVISGTGAELAPVSPDPILGLLPDVRYAAQEVTLPDDDWALLLYTDGLIEGRIDDGETRLGMAGLCALVTEYRSAGAPYSGLPGWLLDQAERRNGGPLADDVAMLLLTKGTDR
jgi:serine phosphatase RsbU (regulator of sigma subunit)